MSHKIWYAPHSKQAYSREEIDAVVQCLEDGWLAGNGPYTTKIENEVAEKFGKKYGLFVNSGSSAILLGLLALNLPEGSEVVTAGCTFSTTVYPSMLLRYKIIFCDVTPNKFVPTVEQIIEKITPCTKLILLPNLVGNKVEWKQLKHELLNISRPDIILFEDSADTISCTLETDISITSLYASHLITAGGCGGMVMFNDYDLRKRAKCISDWGRNQYGDSEELTARFKHNVDGILYDDKFLYSYPGFNFKASEMNAAFGLAQLKKFDNFAAIRRRLVERYISNLEKLLEKFEEKPFELPDDSQKPNWLAFPLLVKNRFSLLNFLEENLIQTRVCFAGNVTRHPMYRKYLQDLPGADRIMDEGCLLGAHHGMTIEDVDYVCQMIEKFYTSS